MEHLGTVMSRETCDIPWIGMQKVIAKSLSRQVQILPDKIETALKCSALIAKALHAVLTYVGVSSFSSFNEIFVRFYGLLAGIKGKNEQIELALEAMNKSSDFCAMGLAI